MASCSCNVRTTSVIVSCQNYEKGPRPRIGMSRETGATIACATHISCTITKIPQVTIQPPRSSIEENRTSLSSSSEREVNRITGDHNDEVTRGSPDTLRVSHA